MAVEETLEGIVEILPSEIASKIDLLITVIGALGGILIIYLIFEIVNFILNRKRNKKIEEIRKDVKFIKDRVNKKK